MTLRPWWQTYFDEFYVDFYAHTLTGQRTAQEVELTARLLDLPAGSRVMDMCCGPGRHAGQLQQRQWQVVGVDFSPYMVKAFQHRNPQLDVVRADGRCLPFAGSFDGAYCLFSSFGYFEDDSQHLRMLQEIRRALRPGGRFVLDMINRDFLVLHHRYAKTHQIDNGTIYLEETEYDWLHSRATTVNRVWREGRWLQRCHITRMFSIHELAALLEAAGFRLLSLAGDLDGAGFEVTSYRQIWLVENRTE